MTNVNTAAHAMAQAAQADSEGRYSDGNYWTQRARDLRKFYIAIHMGASAGGACRTLDGHKEQLEYLKRCEAQRKANAPTHWGRLDDWRAAEMKAIEELVARVERGDIPPAHPLEA